MDIDQPHGLTVPLGAAEREKVEWAAAAAGKPLEEFARDAVLAAAYDPLLAALDQAVATITGRDRAAEQPDTSTH